MAIILYSLHLYILTADGRISKIKKRTNNNEILDAKTEGEKDCSLGEWGEWSQCSKSYGTGFRERIRKTTAQMPGKGSCEGLTILNKLRDREKCQVQNYRCEQIPGTHSPK